MLEAVVMSSYQYMDRLCDTHMFTYTRSPRVEKLTTTFSIDNTCPRTGAVPLKGTEAGNEQIRPVRKIKRGPTGESSEG